MFAVGLVLEFNERGIYMPIEDVENNWDWFDDVLDDVQDDKEKGIDWFSAPAFGLIAKRVFSAGFYYAQKGSIYPRQADRADCKAAAYAGFLEAAGSKATNIRTVKQAERFFLPALSAMEQYIRSLATGFPPLPPPPVVDSTEESGVLVIFETPPLLDFDDVSIADHTSVELADNMIEDTEPETRTYSTAQKLAAIMRHDALLQFADLDAVFDDSPAGDEAVPVFDSLTKRRLVAGSLLAEITGAGVRSLLDCSEQTVLNYASAGKIRRSLSDCGNATLYDLVDVCFMKMQKNEWCEQAMINRHGVRAVRRVLDNIINHPGSPARHTLDGTGIPYKHLLQYVRELLDSPDPLYSKFDDVLFQVFHRFDQESCAGLYQRLMFLDWLLVRNDNAGHADVVAEIESEMDQIKQIVQGSVEVAEALSGKKFSNEAYEDTNEVREII